jgi:hypothetical protein
MSAQETRREENNYKEDHTNLKEIKEGHLDSSKSIGLFSGKN